MKLQVNTSGAWRHVIDFDPARKAEVVKAAEALAFMGYGKWSILHENGHREWLKEPLARQFGGKP